MQVNVNQDAAIRQYTQTVQKMGKTSTVAAEAPDMKEIVSSVQKQDVDCAEFNKDRAVTSKMSESERSSLVQSLKEDLNNQMSRFTNMMMQTFQKQGITASQAKENDFWKMIASGNFTVDPQIKAEAQEAISENGYWGVSQTSQRIFDFAYALAGDDVNKMKEMQAAVEKGFQQAGVAWGGELPSICGNTHTAVTKMFDDYYAQRGTVQFSIVFLKLIRGTVIKPDLYFRPVTERAKRCYGFTALPCFRILNVRKNAAYTMHIGLKSNGNNL